VSGVFGKVGQEAAVEAAKLVSRGSDRTGFAADRIGRPKGSQEDEEGATKGAYGRSLMGASSRSPAFPLQNLGSNPNNR
jgi:hypothetical protein